MGTVTRTVVYFACERCSYEWIPKDIDHPPKVCPKCHSPYWDRPRVRAAKNG